LAANTVNGIVSMLSSVLDSAMRSGQIANNPVKLLERTYHRAREGHRDGAAVRPDEIFSPAEIQRLIAAAKPGLFKTLFTLAAATGMREGELFGLKWSDITFEGQPHISIRRGLSWAKGPLGGKVIARFTAPKTRAGSRDVPIDAAMAVKLKEWKLRSGGHELVFPNMIGQPLRRSDMFRGGWKPALKAAGVPYRKFHALRHSFASALIARGAAVTEVQHLLGHSNSGVTLQVYSHWLKGTDSGAAAAYSAALFGEVQGGNK
jgi:integrase